MPGGSAYFLGSAGAVAALLLLAVLVCRQRRAGQGSRAPGSRASHALASTPSSSYTNNPLRGSKAPRSKVLRKARTS